MCIIFVACGVHPKYPLIVASNRDEFMDRPTQPMQLWTDDNDDIIGSVSNGDSSDAAPQPQNHSERSHHRVSLAGRDLVGGGTWLGVALPDDDDEEDEIDNNAHISLRWIAITNFREVHHRNGRPSRGGLLMEYLDGEVPSASSFVSSLQQRGREYNGFNLLVGDKSGIYYHSNRQATHSSEPLARGIYGLSNGLLDDKWPKVERGKQMLNSLCKEDVGSVESFHEELQKLLSDQTQPSDDQLPQTGIDEESERYLSTIFIPRGKLEGKEYGTLSSTTIVVDVDGKVSVLERTWSQEENRSGADRWFRFDSKGADKLEGILLNPIMI